MEFKKVATTFTFFSTLKMVEKTRARALTAIVQSLPKGSSLSHTVADGVYYAADGSQCSLVSVRITTTANVSTVRQALASVEASAVKARASRAKARVIPSKKAPKAPTVQASGPGAFFGRAPQTEAPASVDVAPIVRRVVREAITRA